MAYESKIFNRHEEEPPRKLRRSEVVSSEEFFPLAKLNDQIISLQFLQSYSTEQHLDKLRHPPTFSFPSKVKPQQSILPALVPTKDRPTKTRAKAKEAKDRLRYVVSTFELIKTRD